MVSQPQAGASAGALTPEVTSIRSRHCQALPFKKGKRTSHSSLPASRPSSLPAPNLRLPPSCGVFLKPKKTSLAQSTRLATGSSFHS